MKSWENSRSLRFLELAQSFHTHWYLGLYGGVTLSNHGSEFAENAGHSVAGGRNIYLVVLIRKRKMEFSTVFIESDGLVVC